MHSQSVFMCPFAHPAVLSAWLCPVQGHAQIGQIHDMWLRPWHCANRGVLGRISVHSQEGLLIGGGVGLGGLARVVAVGECARVGVVDHVVLAQRTRVLRHQPRVNALPVELVTAEQHAQLLA